MTKDVVPAKRPELPEGERPPRWGLWVNAAFVRSLPKGTQEIAAKAAGIGLRTLQRWEQSPWWAEALREAHDRWLGELDKEARESLLEGIKREREGGEKPELAQWVAERRFPELGPPSRKTEVSGPGGGPVPIVVGSVPFGVVRPDGEDT